MLVAASAYKVVLALHIMAVVVAFGVTFAYPIMFAVGARHDPGGLALLHRVEYTIERWLINPGLLLVLLAGAYLASDGDHWGEFYVQWGLAATIVIGGLVGSVMIPTAKRAEVLAAREVASSEESVRRGGSASRGDGVHQASAMSEEYRALTRRLATVGWLLSVLVLVTILFMVIKP